MTDGVTDTTTDTTMDTSDTRVNAALDATASAGTCRFRFSGRLDEMEPTTRQLLLDRSTARDASVEKAVTSIITRIANEGDTALRELALQYDSVELTTIEVPHERLERAASEIDANLRRALERSAANIETVHRGLLPSASVTEVEPGVLVGRRPDPLGRVGVYAPGGRAAYPSSVLMGAIPARVAGVSEVVLCSPPAPDGVPSLAILAAAHIAEVDRVFSIGGAGAIAAMCMGTHSIPRVDKVVGPGNAFVAEAKLQLASFAAFDSPAGPSELLVIADNTATPEVVAREIVAQAEHDPRSIAVVIALGTAVGAKIQAAISRAALGAQRNEIVVESLAAGGGVVVVDTIEEAITLASDFAPEHLLVATEFPDAILPQLRNAGTVFLGETSSVAFGDYMTGANHVLPTGGLARCYSGLSTLDFIRWTTYQSVDSRAAAAMASDVGHFADAEGLHAHAAAARGWAEASR